MHLQNRTPGMADIDKDFRVCIWHSVVSLEQTITVITGRPSMVRDRDCSVPLPQLKLRDGSFTRVGGSSKSGTISSIDFAHRSTDSTSSAPALGMVDDRPSLLAHTSSTTAYFRYYVELHVFTQSVITGLYNPEVKHLKWATIQKRILKLDHKLLQWASALPKEFDIQSPAEKSRKNPLQVALSILINSTRTIINRPCLCRMELHIPNQSKSSLEINRDSVNKCINSARAILALLPDRTDTQSCHSGPIWWVLHHHLRRAGTVLLLELAFRGRHMPSETNQVLLSAQKAVHWLQVMATASAPANRSWITLSRLLDLAEHRIGENMADGVDSHQPHSTATTNEPSLPTTGWYSPAYGTAALDAWQPLDEYSHLQGQDTPELRQFREFQDAGMSNTFPTSGEVDGVAAEDEQEDQFMSYNEDDPAQWINFQGGQ